MCISMKVISVTPITTGMVASTRLTRYLASIYLTPWPGGPPSTRPRPVSSLLSVRDENVLHPRPALVGVVRADVEILHPLVDTPEVVGVEEDRGRQLVGEDVLNLGIDRFALVAVGGLQGAVHELVDLRVAVRPPVQARRADALGGPQRGLVGVGVAVGDADEDDLERLGAPDLRDQRLEGDRPWRGIHADVLPLLLHDLDQVLAYLVAGVRVDLERHPNPALGANAVASLSPAGVIEHLLRRGLVERVLGSHVGVV